LLKKLGNESQVIQHLNKAIKLNPLSASLKRSFSEYLRTIGKPDSAERMYQRASILEPDHFSHVLESTHVFRHTQKSIIAMAEWQSANAELFTSCSSDEYCEQVVLAYLSIGANEAANNILAKMGPKHGHFLNSLDLINFGIKGEEQKILSIKERLALYRPNNRIVLFDLAVAQFRAEQFKQAKITLLKLEPESIRLSDITADNYMALVLYAVTLFNLDEKQIAEILLHKVQTFLKQDKVFDKIQAVFTLAEINAQLNNTPQALHHLATALDMGWLESNNREWWSLQNNHLFRPLYEEPEFKLLLKQHQEKLNELREKVTRRLSTIPSSIE
jgi:tetratricopeptide (TPR) repeat protein